MTAELLRRAADLIEQRAKTATNGPWRWDTFRDIDELTHPMGIGGMPVHPLNVLKVSHEDWPANDADKEWIAMLSPVIAAPLAAWLRIEADMADNPLCVVVEGAAKPLAARVPATAQPFALAMARAILGETL